MQRPQITKENQEKAIQIVMDRLSKKLLKKNRQILASNHEILGRISQELSEYEDAIHMRTIDSEKISELADVALYAIMGIASILGGECD